MTTPLPDVTQLIGSQTRQQEIIDQTLGSNTDESQAPVQTSFAKRKRKGQASKKFRKRNRDEADSEPQADMPAHTAPGSSPSVQTTSAPSDESEIHSLDAHLQAAKRARIETPVNAQSTRRKADVDVHFSSTGNDGLTSNDDMATRTLQIHTDTDRDARAIFERGQANQQLKEDEQGNKIYRGQAAYRKDFSAGGRADAEKRGVAVGPLRASSNLRSSVAIDYQPDVCKDYKETGYCGYGDTCIYLHDRGDYKQGWQIDREWEQAQAARSSSSSSSEGDSSDAAPKEPLPWACFICRKAFTNPVKTRCGHFFCQGCALTRFRKTSKCAVCKKDTQGAFVPAAKELQNVTAPADEPAA